MIILGKLHKALIFLKIFFWECFCKCQVVKMSAYFNRDGSFSKENWGDDINYWFLREIIEGRLISYDWSWFTQKRKRPYVLGIGSIIAFFNIDNAVIWGSGIMSSSTPIDGHPLAVKAVRGPLSRKFLMDNGIDCPEVYGDPALLIPHYYTPNVTKKYKLGIIPHYKDKNNRWIEEIGKEEDILVIDIQNYDHWLDFIDQICQCEIIASSSLHGLIMSEAYGVPNVWIKFKEREQTDDIKFHDFFLSIVRDRNYTLVTEGLGYREICETAQQWKKGEIDLTPLIEACPLKLKESVKIVR